MSKKKKAAINEPFDIQKYLDWFPIGEGYNNIIRQEIRSAATKPLPELRKHIDEGYRYANWPGVSAALSTLEEIFKERSR